MECENRSEFESLKYLARNPKYSTAPTALPLLVRVICSLKLIWYQKVPNNF